MTPEERASIIVGYLIGCGLPDWQLENLRQKLIITIRDAVDDAREELLDDLRGYSDDYNLQD